MVRLVTILILTRLQPYFQFLSTPYGTQLLGTEGNVLPNPNLRPELLTTFEVGADLYVCSTTVLVWISLTTRTPLRTRLSLFLFLRLLVSVLSSSTLVRSKVRVSRLLLNIVPVRTKDFEWSANINFTRARSK